MTLRIVFAAGPRRFVAEGLWYSGCAANGKGDVINLREPGTVRRIIDELAVRGELPDNPGRYEVDGWTLFEALAKD